ncbi:hypothetical protein [Actinophytocola sp.]|uniref:hypothetical protein n=1 Tax=Actinophytocola sp. TaxID=1872138 RepID=UPI002D7EB666|nr:hypothetical protein [Actinophytocola sp.]HET9143693.1 hypothetical protein [Actinophytocola sp.]
MSLHVFIDESRRGNLYLLAAALVMPADLGPTRALMRSLRVPGERKVHLHQERGAVKKEIAAALVTAGVRARVYVGHGPPDATRARLLRAAVTDLVAISVRRLVLDSRGQDRDQLDRRVIRSALTAGAADPGLMTYEHLRSHEDPALWVADVVAWCHGAGGEWRRRIGPVVERVIDLDEKARSPGARRPARSCPGPLPRPSGLGC